MRLEFTSVVGGLSALFAGSLMWNRALSEMWPWLRVDVEIGPWWSLALAIGLSWAMRDAFGRVFRDDR